MAITELFWFFFMISALQPVITRRVLEYSRQRMISKIEHDRGSRVILLVHRQETMNFLGFPVYRYIDVDDSEEVLRAIHMTDREVPIDLILHTPGGLVLAALQIAKAIKKHKGKVTAFVPHYAIASEISVPPDSRRDCHVRACRSRPGGSPSGQVPGRIDS